MGFGMIARAEFVRSNERHILVSYASGQSEVLDAETGQQVLQLAEATDAYALSRVYGARTHPVLHVATTSHGDCTIRFHDLTSGACVHAMIAHEAAVSCLDFDPSGLFLVSGGMLSLYS